LFRSFSICNDSFTGVKPPATESEVKRLLCHLNGA
jgi:hypothetical protein